MLRMRSSITTTIMAAALILALAGCILPEEVGLTLIVSPESLNFGARTELLILKVNKNFSSSSLEPVVATTNQPWIIIGACTDLSDGCLSRGPLDNVDIPVRVDRTKMNFGSNEGLITLRGSSASLQTVRVFAEAPLQVDFRASSRTPRIGDTVMFTDQSIVAANLGPIVGWFWEFGDGATSALQNPIHTYHAPGIYDVSLTITTPNGQQKRTETAFIVVNDGVLRADFTASVTVVPVDGLVTFSDLSTAPTPIVAWEWNFGDGRRSTQQNPTHQYRSSGLYTVSLTVSTAFTSATETKTEYIAVQSKVPPQANFAITQISPYVFVPVKFVDLTIPGSSPIIRWVWTFGDGIASTDQNPTHTYQEAGEYEVKLSVVAADGATSSKVLPIVVVFMPPTADFEADTTNPSTGEEVQFTDLSLPGTAPVNEWLWDFGDFKTSTEQNPVHIYTRAGTYTVKLTVSTGLPGLNSDTLVKTDYITVIDPPAVDFTYTPDSPFITDTIAFTNLTKPGSEANIRYLWNFDSESPGSDATSTEVNPSFQYETLGTYVVTLRATTPTRQATASKTVIVDAAPVPDFSAVTRFISTADPVRFTNLTETEETRPVTSRRWNFGDGASSTAENPRYTYPEPGVYTVSLTNNFTHSGTGKNFTLIERKVDYITVTEPIPPSASFVADPQCVTLTFPVQFTNTSSLGSASTATYFWDFGDGTTSTQRNPRHTYPAFGTYTVTLTVTSPDRYAPNNVSTIAEHDIINVRGEITPLDFYISAPDSSYQYNVVSTAQRQVEIAPGINRNVAVHIVNMISQTWRSLADYRVVGTDSADWQHYMRVVVPQMLTADTALLFIDGGSNGGAPPAPGSVDETFLRIAAATGSVVTQLSQVPNQSLEFTDETGLRTRSEDESISYTYNKWIESYNMGVPDDSWPLLLPMAKSAVRAMDTVQDMYTSQRIIPRPVNDFFVAGASKRGWTTWLTAAYEQGPFGKQRVKAIAPIVIDVLNMDRQMMHHFNAYGYWAPAIYPYAQEKIFDRFETEPGQALLRIVDPFEYRCRLTMPKFIMNSTGDQFFLPDSSQFYFDRQEGGSNYLNYVPNTEHSLDGSVSLEDDESAATSLLSFYAATVYDTPLPQFSWTFEEDGSILLVTRTSPRQVRVWSADITDTRDFRLDKIGAAWESSAPIIEAPNARYRARITPPAEGWTGFFIQVQFNNPLSPLFPFTFTTPVRVLPDVYPEFNGRRIVVGSGIDATPMVIVQGSPHEMGRQYGQLMSGEINAFIPAFYAGVLGANPELSDEVLDATWESVRNAADPGYPGEQSRFEEELHGIAEGAGIDYDLLRRANMIPMLANFTGNAVAAVRSASLFESHYQSNSINESLAYGLQNFPCVVMYVPGLGQGLPHANITFAGFAGALTGINLGGVAVSSVQDPDQPGDPLPFFFQGNHYSAMFREILYDSASIRQARDIAAASRLFRRQHIVVGEGRNLVQAVKAQYTGSSNPPTLWELVDLEYFPQVLSDVFYAGPRSGVFAPDNVSDGPAFSILRADLGAIEENTLADVTAALAPEDGNNLLNVIYRTSRSRGAAGLDVWFSYALGDQPAYTRPYTHINLQDYLP